MDYGLLCARVQCVEGRRHRVRSAREADVQTPRERPPARARARSPNRSKCPPPLSIARARGYTVPSALDSAACDTRSKRQLVVRSRPVAAQSLPAWLGFRLLFRPRGRRGPCRAGTRVADSRPRSPSRRDLCADETDRCRSAARPAPPHLAPLGPARDPFKIRALRRQSFSALLFAPPRPGWPISPCCLP